MSAYAHGGLPSKDVTSTSTMSRGDAVRLPARAHPVTLITTFRLRDAVRPDEFIDLWTGVGMVMARRRGFVSGRLYPAGAALDPMEYIHVAHWTRADLLAIAQSDPEVKKIQEGVKKLVAFQHRVLCDAPLKELVPLSDVPRRPGIRHRIRNRTLRRPGAASTGHHRHLREPGA